METQILTMETIMKDFNELKVKQTIFSLSQIPSNTNLLLELEGIGDDHIMCKAEDGKLYYIFKAEEPETLIITPISNSENKENVSNLFTVIRQSIVQIETPSIIEENQPKN